MISFVKGYPTQNALDLLKKGDLIIINSKLITSPLEVESAYRKAKRSFEKGSNISHDVGSETMLYLLGKRQISEAIKKFGLNERDNEYFIISEKDLDLESLGFKKIDFEKKCVDEDILKRLEEIAIFEIKK